MTAVFTVQNTKSYLLLLLYFSIKTINCRGQLFVYIFKKAAARRKLLQILGNCRCNRKETNLSARITFTKEANGGNRKILSVQPSVFVYLCKSNQSASSRIEQFAQVTKRMFCHRLHFRPVSSNNWKALAVNRSYHTLANSVIIVGLCACLKLFPMFDQTRAYRCCFSSFS